MIVRTYPNGDLGVPARAESDGVVGDGMMRIGPDHPDYMEWQDAIDNEIVDTVPADEEVRVEEHGEYGPTLVDGSFQTEKEAERRETTGRRRRPEGEVA